MADAAATRPSVPLEMWPSIVLRLPPLVWGGLVAGVLIVGALLFRLLIVRSGLDLENAPADTGFATRVALVASLSIGYTLGVWRWVSAAQFRDLSELGVLPEGSDTETGFIQGFPPEQIRRSRLAGVCGVAFFVALIEVPGALVSQPFGAAWVNLHALSYMLFLGVLFFWVTGRAAYFSIGRSLFRGALDRLEVDVLDPKPLRTFGRIGSRNALIWITGISIGMLAFVNPEIRIVEALIVLVPLLIVSSCIVLAALLLPVRGLHARLVEAKSAELSRIESAIRGDNAALAGSPIAQREPPPSLADLIAYKGLVESAPTWPFDGSTVRRLGLYLLIPVGSWVGGALVERALAVALD